MIHLQHILCNSCLAKVWKAKGMEIEYRERHSRTWNKVPEGFTDWSNEMLLFRSKHVNTNQQ